MKDLVKPEVSLSNPHRYLLSGGTTIDIFNVCIALKDQPIKHFKVFSINQTNKQNLFVKEIHPDYPKKNSFKIVDWDDCHPEIKKAYLTAIFSKKFLPKTNETLQGEVLDSEEDVFQSALLIFK